MPGLDDTTVAAAAEVAGHHPDIDIRWTCARAASTLRLVLEPPACSLVSYIDPECSSTRSQAQGVPDLGSQPGQFVAASCASQSILAARELHASRSEAELGPDNP